MSTAIQSVPIEGKRNYDEMLEGTSDVHLLITAIETKSTAEAMKFVLDVEDMNEVVEHGRRPKTAFWAAAHTGNVELGRILVLRGAQVDLVPYIKGSKVRTTSPFVEAVAQENRTFVDYILSIKPKIDFADELSTELRVRRATFKNVKYAEDLLKDSKKTSSFKSIKNTQDRPDVVEAVRSGDYDTLASYVRNGGDINLRSTKPEDRDRTILMIAILNNRVEMIKLLIRKGANTELRDADKRFAEMIAEDEYNAKKEVYETVHFYERMPNYFPYARTMIRIEKPIEKVIRELIPKINSEDLDFFKREYQVWISHH